MALRLLIDSADVQSWEQLWPLGLFHGITTNPTLLRRAGLPCNLDTLGHLVHRAHSLGCREVHLQAWGSSTKELQACAESLLSLGPEQIVIKLPLTRSGLLTGRGLVERGHRVTLTACYGRSQVLAAVALGATYVAPYLGRISDGGRDGCAEVLAMQKCLQGVGTNTRLLVASLRSLDELLFLVPAGVDTFTVSSVLAQQIWSHPETEKAAERFEKDVTPP